MPSKCVLNTLAFSFEVKKKSCIISRQGMGPLHAFLASFLFSLIFEDTFLPTGLPWIKEIWRQSLNRKSSMSSPRVEHWGSWGQGHIEGMGLRLCWKSHHFEHSKSPLFYYLACGICSTIYVSNKDNYLNKYAAIWGFKGFMRQLCQLSF